MNAATAQEVHIPNFWDPEERFIRPDITGQKRLRFLTTTDFPPFNFIDRRKRLSGFHVDLARAICQELDLASVCQIQAVPWGQLENVMNRGDGDAIIAGIALNVENRKRFAFTQPYFRIPGRITVRHGNLIEEPVHNALAGKRIGVVEGSAHQAYLATWLANTTIAPFANSTDLFAALADQKIDAAFSDGLTAAFWITAEKSKNCCRFSSGPFLAPEFFGHGLAIAMPKENRALAEAMNYALRTINDKGIFAELYLRYFPMSLY